MKRLLERIREILRNRHNRRAWTRIISAIACLVVFFSTYALILPAITMEKNAYCGIEAHQHDDSCYSEKLICTIPESEGHTHDDSCYTTHDELSCQLEEHVHGEGCYDEEGNLICELIEHEHDSSCWQEVTELTCGLEESEGHHHTDACYEKVLTCGKEAHTHSEACYELNGPEAAGTAATDARGVVIGGDNSGKPADDKTAEVDVSTVGETDPNAATDSAAVGLTTGAAADPDAYVPTLDELDFNRILNRNTGIYYYHVETAEDADENQGDAENIGEEDKNQGKDQAGEQAKSHPEEINSADIPADAWQKVNKKTVLGENDILRVYFSYTIPAGSLNETNDIARYRLPANLHINDDQIKAINKTENGIAAAFIDYDTLAITDADAYHKYLGVEAVEGTRRPGEIPAEDVQEYISAVVRVENIYDTEGLYGKKDALLGQDLVFTFVPYTVQTNQNTYNAQGDPTSAGETVKGWFTMDLTIDQIDFQPTSSADSSSDSSDPTSGTREAEIVFVEEYRDPAQGIDIDEISTKLVLKDMSGQDIQEQDDSAEDADNPENAENPEQAENVDDADNSEPVGEAADESDKEASAEGDAEKDTETETDLDETNYPAHSFQDSITVRMGSLSTDTNAVNTSEDSGNTTAAAPDIQDRTELTVSVEAEEGTFPEGTTMHLAPVTGSDLDTVAEAVEGAVESRTAGFHAVDITFRDADGNEIEPRKPIKVSMQSESIRQAVENPSTAPVVVHVGDNKKEHEKDNITENGNDNKDEGEADRKDEKTAEADSSSGIRLDSATVTGTTVPGAAEADNLTFEADSFSVYAVVYTVDFAYEEYTYSIRGGNSILLSDMVKELHISDNDAAFMSRVKNVEFTDPALMRVTYINNPTTVAAVEEYIFDGVFDDAEKEPGSNRKLDEGEWLLTSLAPFKTEEALTITLDSGRQIVITVLDGQEVAGNTFITDAHLTIDGTTYGKDEPWTVYPDVGYTMKLSFAEKGQNQFPAGGDTIVVDLPQGLTLEGNVHHTFTIPAGLAGSITGNEYWVENGKLYVKFGEDPEDILTRSSNAHFDLTFTARFDEGTTNIPFNDKVEPNIDMDITADVSVSKSASYNSTTGKMDYTITVKSTGNSEDVKVHDALTNTNLLKIDTDSIRISPAGTEYNITDSSQGGFDMTIPSIGHNQTVTITYSADVDTSALDHKGNIKVSDDGKNTVTVENDDDDHDDDTNTYTNRIKYSSTSKTSTSVVDHETEQDPDNKTATLGWKIVLNDNYRGSIVGDKVWDSIDWSSKDAMKYTVDENGNITLHIAAKSQDGMKTYNTTVTAAVVTDPNGVQSWEYTIPQLGEDPDEILSYEITYTTEVNKTELDSSSNGIVKNNTTNEGDGSSTATGVVPIPHSDEPGEDEIVGGKAAVDVTEEYVDWDIVINVPAEGFPDGLTVTDYVPMAPQYGGFADTYDSILSVTGLVNGETYTVDCVSTDVDENGNVIWDLRNYNRKRDVVTIKFYQDAQKTRSGLSGTGQARTLTIRIRTKNDPAWLAYIEREGSGDSNAYYHTNIAKANNTTFEGKAAPQKSKIYKTLIAGNETADDGMPVYRYAVDLAGVKSLPIVIEDTFNADELEYYDYWYITDTHQYIDGKPQRHMLNNGISPYKADIVAENGKITITAEDLPRKENGDFWEYYRIYYKLKVKNQTALDSFTQKAIENGGVYNVRNTAAWNGTDDHVDIEFKVPTVEKTGAFRVNQGESGNDRLYDFAIDINEKCLELNGGESMDLTDTHTDNLTVDYTTIKVYKYENGEKVQDTSIQWNFDGNIGTFYNLQDRTHYVIEYSCLVIGSATQSFSNYAEMNGFHGEKHDSRDFGTTVEAGADVFQIGLIKFKNGMTSQGLGGATFQLFRGTGSFHEVTNGTDTWMEEDRIPMTWGVGTETAGKVGQNITFTTNEDGYVLIALDQTKHGAELEEGVHYFLKEIESPPGYQIDSSVEYWEFTLTKDPDEVCYGTKRDQYGNRLWIYFYYDDILKMNNTETDQPITVDVDKEWFDFQGNKIENPEGVTAKVQLYQKKNNEDYAAVETITNADGTIYNGEITLPVNGSWEYSWEKLPRADTDGNGYAYKLEEVEVPEDYVSSYTLNETENEKNYHLKNYQVTERKVNVSVTKTWLNEDGKTEIAVNDLPENLQAVQFYLYRVISRAPFTTAPTSGGNPYTIEGNPYLVTGPVAEPGLYSISRAQFQAGISFEELPSVHKDDDGNWYFYSYYVKEVPVDGYSASVDVTETQDEQNNTILLSSMKNKKKPDERTTNLNVEKVWKDKEGRDKSWPEDTIVRFKLYQVRSTEPFNEQPTSGGTLYNVAQVNYNDHPNKISGQDGLYQIGHTYNGAVLRAANFENLPEVTIDSGDHATYYAYYVDEVEVTGYESSYSYDTSESGKVKVTMTNRQEPDYTQLSVEKKWFDGETELTGDDLTDLEATVELVRYRAEPRGATVHFYRYSDGHFVKMEGLELLVKQNETINIHFNGISNGANAYYGYDSTALAETETYKVNTSHGYQSIGYIQPEYNENASIVIGNQLDVYVVFYVDISISSTSTDQAATDSGSVTIDPDFEQFNYNPKQTVLSAENGFKFTYPKLLTTGKGSDGKTYYYSYGIREVSVPAEFEFVSYSVDSNEEGDFNIPASNPGSGTITVNNKKKEMVDVDIIKIRQNSDPVQYLDGAVFSLRQIADVEPIEGGTYGEADNAIKKTGETANGGKLTFEDLVDGYYELTETKAPAGYVLTGDTRVYFKVDGIDVIWLQKGSGPPSTWDACTSTSSSLVTFKNASEATANDPETPEDESVAATNAAFTIRNTPGSALPQTGGPGTNLIYLIGLTFTAFAGAGLVMKKRRRNAA